MKGHQPNMTPRARVRFHPFIFRFCPAANLSAHFPVSAQLVPFTLSHTCKNTLSLIFFPNHMFRYPYPLSLSRMRRGSCARAPSCRGCSKTTGFIQPGVGQSSSATPRLPWDPGIVAPPHPSCQNLGGPLPLQNSTPRPCTSPSSSPLACRPRTWARWGLS